MRGCLLARAALARLCAAVLLGGMLVGQGLAAIGPATPHPPSSNSKRAPSAPAAQPPAAPQVVWPDNGIAQRRLDGGFNYNMFVENDNGTWRAWVQSDMTDIDKKDWSRAKALDFFSGQVLMVEAYVDEYLLQQRPGFWDPKEGKGHGPEDRTFMFDPGTRIPGIAQGPLLTLDAERCGHYILGLRSAPLAKGESHPSWAKIPLIYHKPSSDSASLCKEGSYWSGADTTLDLNDGTFLVTMECWIFRLRKSDLTPVGEAPALRIVDEAAMKAAIDKAEGQHIESGTAYLSRALSLHIDDAYACSR